MDRLYAEHDKIRFLKTGQILTVHADLSNHLEPGIIVKERVGRLIGHREVQAAESIHQKFDLEAPVAYWQNETLEEERLYAEHDKIVLLETGQVLTVHADLSNHLEPGIIVKEKIGRLIRRSDVLPVGAAGPQLDLEDPTPEQEPPLTPPENGLPIETPEESQGPLQNNVQPEPKLWYTPKPYSQYDKIVLKDTGEVLTVLEDLGYYEAPAITVYEDIGRRIMRWEVHPAGNTRQRRDAAIGITEPEPPPPPPDNRLSF